METFSFFLLEGFRHISDLSAYDHILFIAALAGLSTFKDWKLLLKLVTAFTLGHSLALALATLEIVKIPSELIEFFIPVSIMLTCWYNLVHLIQQKKAGTQSVEEKSLTEQNNRSQSWFLLYGIITFFGLIHGLGFSNYLRFILMEEENLFVPLLGFNVGLEFGQILILIVSLGINFVLLKSTKMSAFTYFLLLNSLIFIASIPLAYETGQALYSSFLN